MTKSRRRRPAPAKKPAAKPTAKPTKPVAKAAKPAGHTEPTVKIGVLVSGAGTNLQALLDAEARGELAPAEIAVVISNRPDAYALERARVADKDAIVVDHKHFVTRDEFDRAVIAELDAWRVEVVVLAGFMRILSPVFIAHYPMRVINTHPSLLPAFPGADAPAQAIAHGVKLSGVTIHFVDDSLDGGPIIEQVAVPVHAGDTADALHKRIQAEEHALLPRVVQRLAAGRLSCQGRRVMDSSRAQ